MKCFAVGKPNLESFGGSKIVLEVQNIHTKPITLMVLPRKLQNMRKICAKYAEICAAHISPQPPNPCLPVPIVLAAVNLKVSFEEKISVSAIFIRAELLSLNLAIYRSPPQTATLSSCFTSNLIVFLSMLHSPFQQ